MDEIINQVTKNAGITPDQAKKAVETVIAFLNQKLPAPIAAQISGLLKGGSPDDLMKGVSKLFG